METRYYSDKYNCYYENSSLTLQIQEKFIKIIKFSNRNDVTTVSTWGGMVLTILLMIL